MGSWRFGKCGFARATRLKLSGEGDKMEAVLITISTISFIGLIFYGVKLYKEVQRNKNKSDYLFTFENGKVARK